MAALVAYPVASRHDRGLRRQRIPRSRIGWDDRKTVSTTSCDLDFSIACMYLQQAMLRVISEPCESSSAKYSRDSAFSLSAPAHKLKDLKTPTALPINPPPPSTEDSPYDVPPDYTSTESLAQCQLPLPLEVPTQSVTATSTTPETIEPLFAGSSKIDFSSLQDVRTHGKGGKKKKATPVAFSFDDNEKKEEGTAGGDGDAGGGAGDASGGAGGAGGDDGNGGDDKGDEGWDDWSGAKGKKNKKKKKQDDEEEEEEKPKDEKDEWAGVGGDGEWGTWGATGGTKSKKKTDRKSEEDPAASTNAWADTAGGAEDEDWNGFSSAAKPKKKNKKKQADEPGKSAEDSFHEIKLDDELDLGAPKISLSFDEPAAAKKEETSSSSGFGFGGWGSSWSFGGLGGKKDEDKEKNGEKSPGSGSFWNKSNLSNFDFGFGANADGKSFDIGDSKKPADDEDDFLPAWGGGTTTKKPTDKKPKFGGIEEVDDPPPEAKNEDDTWGGWGKKSSTSTSTSKKETTPTDSWSGWGSNPTATSGKKDTKKKAGASWADIMEEEDDTTALPSIKDDKKGDDTWGMWGTKDKESKKAEDDIWGGFEAGSKKKDSKAGIQEVKEDDLSVLKGLTCEKDGKLLDADGNPIGELYEGDAGTISRRLYLCSEKGEFKDKKFRVIGKARLLPKEEPAQEEAAAEDAPADSGDADAPPLSVLEGLCCERDGNIKDFGGKIVGKVVEGNAAEFASKMFFCDGNGNVNDYKNNPVGRCITIGTEKPKKEVKDDDIWGWAATSKSSKVPPPPKGSAKADKKKDEKKDDTWGTWGSEDKAVEEEKPEEPASSELPPSSILEDRTVDADGKVYNDDNVAIGECIEGDIATIARRKYKINAQGEVMSRLGKVLGQCVTLAQEKKEVEPEPEPPAEEPKEEASVEPPPLSALKGRTIESDGTILSEEGDVIGEVTEGDAERFASITAKCDDKGNILNSKKKVVGKCQTLAPQSVPVTEAPSEVPAEEEPPAPEENAKPTVTLADLMGRKIESNGDVVDDDFNVLAKVVEGNVKQLVKKGAMCDAEGNVVLGKKTLGKVELLVPETPEEIPEPPAPEEPVEETPAVEEEKKKSANVPTLASLEGRLIEASGDVLDDDGNVIGRVIDGKPKSMNKKKATCDANGNVIHGFSTIGQVEVVVPEKTEDEVAVPEPEPEAEEPPPPPPVEEEQPTLAILEGKFIEKNGDILGDDGEVIGRLVMGSASKLYKGNAKCDAEGNVLMKNKIQKDATVELVLPEKKEEEEPPVVEEPPPPEPPAEEVNPMAKLDGLKIEKNGDILNESGDLVALLVTGSASKLHKANATCDAEGKVWAKGKEVKDAKVELIEVEQKEEEPVVEEPAPEEPPAEEEKEPEVSPYAKLDGRSMEKNGDILDEDGNVLATVTGGSLSKMYKAGAVCDGEGKVWAKGKAVKDVTVELVQPPEPEEPPAPEEPIEEPPAAKEPEKPTFASIEGKSLDKFGEIYNDDNVLVARLVEGSAGSLYKKGAYCDADGNVIVNGKKQKTAKLELVVLEDIPEPPAEPEKEAEPEPDPEPVEDEKPAEPEGPALASLDGLPIDISGDILDINNNVVGKLVEGSATKLYAKFAVCTADGKVMVNGKVMKNARVEVVEPEKPAEPEPEAEPEQPEEKAEEEPETAPEPPSLAILDGRPIDRSGDIFDDDMNLIGRLVEGDAKKLARQSATCDAEGQVWAKKKIVAGARVELVEPEKPAEPEPEPEAEAPPPPPPAPKEITTVDLDGRGFDDEGNVLDDDGVIIGKLTGETKKLKAILSVKATCDADGNVWAKGKKVPKVTVELVQPEPPAAIEPEEPAEPEPEPEPEKEADPEPEAPTLQSLDGRALEANGDILDDDGQVIGKLVEGVDKLKLLIKSKAKCDADGNVWAKGKQVPRARVEVVVPEKPAAAEDEKDPVKDLLDSIDNPDDAWGDPWAGSFGKKDSKKKRDSVAESSNADEKALTRINTKSSKASKEDDWDDWTGSAKKDNKKKTDPKVMEAESVDEPDADNKDDDAFGFAFTNKRDKKTTKKKGLIEAIDDDSTPMQKAEAVEEHKSSQEDSDWAFASNRVKAKKAAEKSGKKSSTRAIEDVTRAPSPPEGKLKAIEAAPEEEGEDEDELAPDDSASVYKEPLVKVDSKKKDDKQKASSMWGGIFGRSGAPGKTPTLSQLRKEREEREKKDKEEREKQEQQEREEQERIERERIEAEQAEQERIEQEEREKALKEAQDAEKARKLTKKGKKASSKSKAEEPLPPPPPPPPPLAEIEEAEADADESNDPFAVWGVKRKAVKSANEKASLKSDAKKGLEVTGDEVLPIANTKTAVATSSSSKTGIKTSSKLKTGSIADRIKALQGETKLKDEAELAPPVPPPPPPAPEEEAKDTVPEPSSKKSKKLATSSKSASKSASKKEPEPAPEPVKKREIAPGGFPDSDEEDDLLIDLDESKPPTPPPEESDMGAHLATRPSKKVGSKSASKSSKTPTKASKAKPAKKVSSDSETEAEPEENDKAVTQGSGSTTAVDDQQAVDSKLPTPPPELEKRKSTSPTAKKERPKVVRGATGSAWGFWATSTPKDVRQKAKEGASAPLKGTSSPMMVRPRTVRRINTDVDRADNEPKTSSSAKPTPKRASTFSIFGPAPPRRQSTRSTPRTPSRPHSESRRASPELTGVENDGDDDEIPRVSSKAAKLMGVNPSSGGTTGRRASVKSKGKSPEIKPHQASPPTSPPDPEVDTQQQTAPKDPYDLGSDDDEVMPDNGVDIYAVDSPAVPAGDRRAKRRSVAEASASAKEDEPLVDVDPSLDGARALGADTPDQSPTSRRQSPSTKRSVSRSIPRKTEVGGIMGLFGLRRSNTAKETPRSSDPSFAGGRSRKEGYETDAGYRRSSKRSADDYDDETGRRDRRERRKSRKEVDEGFTTDAAGAQTDYEEAERRRAERRAARRAEKERSAEETRVTEEREARRRERDADKEARRAARRERDEARIQEEVEKRRRAEKEERRAARKAMNERVETTRAEEEARAAKEERRARRRAERETRDTDAERPRGERRRSSYMDGAEEPKRSSRRDSRRLSKAAPADDYFDSRNAGQQSSATPYFGSGGDKTSSWVDSVNREPPAPLAPEDTATVIDPPPEEDEVEHGAESEEEVRRRMHGRNEKRREQDPYRGSGDVRDREVREDRDREERRRERKRRDRVDRGEKISDPDLDKDRRRRSSYYAEPNYPYPDYDGPERPQASKRQSWLKKIPINGLF